MLAMESLEKEVREELLHSLHESGLNRADGEHFRFRQRAIRDCIATLSKKAESPINHEALKSETFPKNYNQAYRHVLSHDDVPDRLYTFTDKLSGVGYPDPFFRYRDRRSGEINGYRLKNEYQRFSSQKLDPIHRFQFEKITKEEVFFGRWFVDDEASRDGLFFEAMMACHALKSESCYSCKFKKALRWNGGGNASWQDIACTNCGATYEIKTKANMEKVESAIRYNSIQGGSFSAWCRLSNSKQSNQKMYLVILPREFTFNRQHQKVFPVTIAEIDKALPKISPNSFNPNNDSIRFKSSVSIKLNTKAKWFDLPMTGEVIDKGAIAVNVFKSRFSEEAYIRLGKLHFDNDIIDDDVNVRKDGESETAGPVADIADEFRKLEIVPDDWEDLASDSD